MKVGTDGALLGAWVQCEGAQHILDIGAGTGLIAMMLAQRAPNALITAIEPNDDAAIDAQANFVKGPFADRIQFEHTDLQKFQPQQHFDLIVCNPPFFQNQLQAPDEGRNMARHAATLTPAALFTAAELLNKDGRIAGIYPYDVFLEAQVHAAKAGLHLLRQTNVKPTPSKAPHRILFTYGQTDVAADQLAIEELIIESEGRHGYSADFKKLLSDFYLHL